MLLRRLFYTVAGCLLSESTALSRVTLQWEAPPRHRGGEGWRVDLSDTVAAAALVTSPLVGEGAACIVQIRHNTFFQVHLNAIPLDIFSSLPSGRFSRGITTKILYFVSVYHHENS
jgi:hypothetical protein